MSRNYDNWEKLVDAVVKRQQFLQFARSPSICTEEDSTRICAGCDSEILQGRFLQCMESVWHPECFCCYACNLPISDYEFNISDNSPYHKSCYKDLHHPRCDVCRNFIPTNVVGLIEYRMHPFWKQRYCPSHEADGTPRCCSCERMEPVDARYIILNDGRALCLECMDSAIMSTHKCQPLYLEIRDFYEGLNMKVEQQFPLLLVGRPALNGHGGETDSTRSICVSEERTVETISREPGIGGYKMVRKCEVREILALYGLPRLLIGSTIVHQMMTAWLRIQGYPDLSPHVEKGICQVLAHMWLDSEVIAGSGSKNISSASTSPSGYSTKRKWSVYEKKLGEFLQNQIEEDVSVEYGNAFREGNKAVQKHGLVKTLEEIRLKGTFPC